MKELEVSPLVRSTAFLIERVGFPVFAFISMLVLCVHSLGKMTDALNKNTEALGRLNTYTLEFRTTVQKEHSDMLHELQNQRNRGS